MGVEIRYNSPVDEHEVAARRGIRRGLRRQRRAEGEGSRHPRPLDDAARNIHIGIEWLGSVHFGHIDTIGERVLIIGVGNTAMDCCRTSRRLGGSDVEGHRAPLAPVLQGVAVGARGCGRRGHRIVENHAPKRFVIENGKLVGMEFERLRWIEKNGKQKSEVIDTVIIPCDDVILAIGQDNAFPWIERDIGIEFDENDMPVVDKTTMQSLARRRLLRRRRGVGPAEHHLGGRARPPGGDLDSPALPGSSGDRRPADGMNLVSTKVGMHAWSYSNDYSPVARTKMQLQSNGN